MNKTCHMLLVKLSLTWWCEVGCWTKGTSCLTLEILAFSSKSISVLCQHLYTEFVVHCCYFRYKFVMHHTLFIRNVITSVSVPGFNQYVAQLVYLSCILFAYLYRTLPLIAVPWPKHESGSFHIFITQQW